MPVYKLTDGRKGWYFQGYFNGKKYKRATWNDKSFKTKSDAERAEREFLNKMEATSITANSIPLDALIDEFLDHNKNIVQATTFKQYNSWINNHIKNYFENADLLKLTTTDFLKWHNYISKIDTQIHYKNKIIGHMKKILFYARKKYRISDEFELVLSERIIGNSERKKDIVIYNDEMFNQFLSNIEEGSFYWVYFQIMYYTGLRISEASALTWRDFDGNKLTINKQSIPIDGEYIVKGLKTKNSYREIYLDDITSSVLLEWKNKIFNGNTINNNLLIFGDVKTKYKEPIKHQKIRDVCKEYSAVAGLPNIKIHELRHSHTTNIYNAGVDAHTAADRMGNTPAVMLNIYTHSNNEKRKNVANLLRK